MHRLFVALFACILATNAPAKDLPKGEFLLTGPVLPGVQDGKIVPVFVHATTTANRIEWSFLTSFSSDDYFCQQYQKCQNIVQTLSHTVDWKDDGTLRLLKTDRKTGDGLAIDRPREDALYVYDALQSLLNNAKLTLTADGGSLTSQAGRRSTARSVTWHPMTLQQTQEAIAFVKSFELSFGELDFCALRQYADIVANPNRTELDAEILAAGRFAHILEQATNTSNYYFASAVPADKVDATEFARVQSDVLYLLRVNGRFILDDARDAGEPDLTSAQLWFELSKQLSGPLGKRINDLAPGYLETATTTLQTEIIAAIRHSARLRDAGSYGGNLMQAVCNDIRLPRDLSIDRPCENATDVDQVNSTGGTCE